MNLKKVLQQGKKYTIIYFDNEGWPRSRQFIFIRISIKSEPNNAAFKRQTIMVSGDVKDIKWDKFIVLRQNDQFVIWPGYHKVNTSINVWRGMIDFKGGNLMAEKRWPYKDPRYLLRAMKELKITPVTQYLLPLQPEQLIIYQTISEKQ